ncbi:hypothetical protein [Streptomyces sp. BA2]|uniref:hypothetical protein n=1 Tax=Streptomyces sp. BA2 TaxID=436595 RepID=UPI0013220E1E|nr:hypothetical protein [Streptomyces sp. BA2]MWA16182.1 hypothetical protein [Streptomyces sp. BA2]
MSADWGLITGIVGAATGVVGMAMGFFGWSVARKGNSLAEEANTKSDVANRLAREANALAHHQDRRETESHDIRWEGEWVAAGRYALVVKGTHTAYDVVARVSIDDESQRVERPSVGPGEQIIFDFPEARRTYEEELRARCSEGA